jgi:hypothetical protein
VSRLTAQKNVFSSNATITQKIESESKKVVGGSKRQDGENESKISCRGSNVVKLLTTVIYKCS